MSLTPQITLTANLENILGGEEGGYLEITLCGFGATLPAVAGTCMLADAGIPRRVGPQAGSTPISQLLWGNDAISPPGTFYAVAVLDSDQNVVQCGMYAFTGSGTIDLSEAVQIMPMPAQILSLVCNKLNGDTPGSAFTLPTPSQGAPLLVLYNGAGLRPPTDLNPDYSFMGEQVLTNFEVNEGEELYALYIQALG